MDAARTLSISIRRSPEEVYAFVVDSRNLPRWAAGLDPTLHVRFAEANALGVLDHWVTLRDGVVVYVPMRVVANGDGAEVLFTLFNPTPEDTKLVERDLQTLKTALES
jgi:hypothetical protein